MNLNLRSLMIQSYVMRPLRLFALLSVIFISFRATGQIDASSAETCIQQLMQSSHVVGLSVAVVKRNKIVYTKAFGVRDLETKTPLATSDMFRIASISKSFSATSVMQLVEAGKLSLDADVSDLIGFPVRNPKFPDVVITLRLLMSHLSSINDSQGYFSLDFINPSKNPDWAKCYSDYAPGKGYKYCNLNFNMTGTIIERTSGERFDQYVKHHILDPLGLYGGYCVDSLDRSRFATIYEWNSDSSKFFASPGAYEPRSELIANYTMGYSAPLFSPTGGMKISAPDLAEWMILHSKGGKHRGVRIISKKSSKLMQTPNSDEEHYGFAIEQTDKMIPGEHMTGHTGSAYGLFSAMFFNPKEKFGIVVISNGCDIDYQEGFNRVIRTAVNCLYDGIIKK
jgi:CubicO group peptidase (beta-lactamase class C family)